MSLVLSLTLTQLLRQKFHSTKISFFLFFFSLVCECNIDQTLVCFAISINLYQISNTYFPQIKEINFIKQIRSCLVMTFKQRKLLFKHHNTYFYILFYPHVFPQNLNNITRNLLPNSPLTTSVSCW